MEELGKDLRMEKVEVGERMERVREKMCDLICNISPQYIKSSLIDGNIIGERTFSRIIPFSG